MSAHNVAAIADTHTIIWYLHKTDAELSDTARRFIDDTFQAGSMIGLSAITLIEVVYLIEKRKISSETLSLITRYATAGEDSHFAIIPVYSFIVDALTRIQREEMPDMPDRIIAATAVSIGIPLITRDSKINKSSVVQTIW